MAKSRRSPRPRSATLTKAELQRENARLRRALKLERARSEDPRQQAAMAEILGIISRSPGDAQPVFDAIAVNALRLCDAVGAAVVRYDGQLLHLAAYHAIRPDAVDRLRRQYPRPPDRHSPMGQAVLDAAVVVVPDLQAAAEFSGSVARQFGARSHVSIPLMHEGRPLGAIGISRRTVRAFSDREIALLRTFADQAVIAIENVRLFTELQEKNRALTDAHAHVSEALEQQTATSEILRVISSSPTDVQPVFDAIAASAVRLCDGAGCVVVRFDGSRMHLVAQHTPVPEVAAVRERFPMPPDRSTGVGRAIVESAVRLFTELQTKNRALTEALDQQTATSEVLRVISESPTDVQPVFNAIAESAVRLTQAHFSGVMRFDGATVELVALRPAGLPFEDEFRATFPMSGARLLPLEGVLAGDVRHVADMQSDTSVPHESRRRAEIRGYRGLLQVPMLKDGRAVGVIVVARRHPGAFSDPESTVLKTFAAQAVIAIENVRLFRELQDRNRQITDAHAKVTVALEQQTATSEILRVISGSPTDTQPVFDAIVRSAVSLCDGLLGTVLRVDGDQLDLAAHYNVSQEGVQAYRETYPMPIGRETVAGNAVLDRRVIHVLDAQDEATVPPRSVALARAAGFRGVVAVPLLRAGEPIGLINVARSDCGPFSDRHIELIQTFANQAVIAIENARLFTELQFRTNELTRSVEELRALREVGQAVSSTLDLDTVLDTVAARATELSAAQSGLIYGYDESRTEFHLRAAGGPRAANEGLDAP